MNLNKDCQIQENLTADNCPKLNNLNHNNDQADAENIKFESYLLSEKLFNLNALTNSEYTYEKVKSIADWLLERVNMKPKIAIVCGSGLGAIGERLNMAHSFPYASIPNFPKSTVVGHKGNLIFGYISNVPVVCMQGRFHAYEGYSNALCTMPMKVFKLMGIETIILTCAAGSINKTFEVGDIMMIKDHVAPLLWTLQNPLVGHNDERFGPRFPATNKIYSKSLRDIFRTVAKEQNVEIKEGVYLYLGGPNYETVSEIRSFAILGLDSVGASTAHEALVASYCGLKVFAVSLITNKTIDEYDSQDFPNHEEVIEIADKRAKDIENLIINFITKLNEINLS